MALVVGDCMSPEAEDDGAEVHDADTGELAARDAAGGQAGQHSLRSRLYDDEAHTGGIIAGVEIGGDALLQEGTKVHQVRASTPIS